MNKIFDIYNFNLIEDNENYYFFRALNMADIKGRGLYKDKYIMIKVPNGQIEKEEIIDIPKEIVDIFSLLQPIEGQDKQTVDDL